MRLPCYRLSCRGFFFLGAKRWNDLLKDLQSIKGIKLLRKDYLIVYLTNRSHEQEFLYLIYCLTVYSNECTRQFGFLDFRFYFCTFHVISRLCLKSPVKGDSIKRLHQYMRKQVSPSINQSKTFFHFEFQKIA